MTMDAEGLAKSNRKRRVLQGVSLILEPGDIHGLLGPNGSGKTTCLHILAGLIPADEGTAFIAGIDIADKRSRHSFGFAPDDLPLPGALTGRAAFSLEDVFLRVTGRAGDANRKLRLMENAFQR